MAEITVNNNVAIPAAIAVTAGFGSVLSFVASSIKQTAAADMIWASETIVGDANSKFKTLDAADKGIEVAKNIWTGGSAHNIVETYKASAQTFRKIGRYALGVAALAGLVAVVNHFRNQK